MADGTSGSHADLNDLPQRLQILRQILSQLRQLQGYAAVQWLGLPRNKNICIQTTAFWSDALQMHWILARNVISACTACFKTENSGFCAQTVFMDLLSSARKNKTWGSCLEGHIRDPGNTKMGETSRRQRRMGESSEGDQGPGRGCSAIDG